MLPGLTSAIVAAGRGQIQYVGTAAATKVGTADTTIALNSGLAGGVSSAVQDGDFVIAIFAVGSTSDLTLSITDGANPYTLIASELWADDTRDTNLRVAYKFVSGDTSTTFGSTGAASDNGGATRVYVFRGVDQSTPLDVAATTATAANSVLANPPSITPSTPGAVIVCIGAGAHGDDAGESFTSSDLSQFVSSNRDATNDIVLGVGQKTDWVSGAFDCAAFTYSNSDSTSNSWAAMSIALRPA